MKKFNLSEILFIKNKKPALYKISALLLIFLFLLTPVIQALAEDPPPPENTGEETNPPTENPASTNPDPMTPQQTAPLQKTLHPEVDQNTGALSFEYPINTPNGRNGQNPNLKLTYNSQDTKIDSIFGSGWSINIPYIERINKHGTEQLYTGTYNDYASSIFGELVQKDSTTYVPKSANDIVALNFQNNIWTYVDKNGNTYTFGSTDSSRQSDPSNTSHIYKWMLSSVADSNGNTISYTYSKDSGQIYPLKITYSIYEINFNLTSRTDVIEGYSKGFFVKTNYVLDNILIEGTSGSYTTKQKYSLTFSTGNNGAKSLLSSIIESSIDSNNVTTSLPATTFSYTSSTANLFEVGLAVPVQNFFPTNVSEGAIIGNINNDAYPDILRAYEQTMAPYSSDKKTLLFNPQTGVYDINQTYVPPSGIMNLTDTSVTVIDGGDRMIDVNGDLKSDMIQTPIWSSTGWTPDVEINNGNGWTHNSTPTFYPSYSPNFPTFTGDFNGDNLPDYIQDEQYNGTHLSINNGTSYTTNGNAFTGLHPFFLYTYSYQLFDINGDGLDDIIYAIVNQPCNSPAVYTKHVYINNGKDWVLDDSYTLPANYYYRWNGCYGSTFKNSSFTDLNGDNLNDIFTQDGQIFINQGKSFIERPLSNNTAFQMSQISSAPIQNPYFVMDTDANGLSDYIYNTYCPDGAIMYNTTPVPSDLLNTITSSYGGTTSITYQSSAQYKDVNGNILNPNLPLIIQTVKSITTTDPVNNVSGTTNYSYENGLYFYNNAFNRKFAGFNTVVKIDPAGNKTITYFHQGNTSDSTQGEYQDNEYKIGRIYREEIYDSNGNKYETYINKWESVPINSDSSFIKLSRTTTQTYDGTGNHKDTATEYTYDNNTGNITQKINWGEVTASNDGSFTDTGTDKSTENISYAYTSGNSIIGLPSQNTLLDQNSNKVSESKYYYDNLSLGQVDKGNQTKVEQWVSGTTYINSQKSYNSLGLVTTETDERGKVTSYTYDQYNLYPSLITDPMNQTTSYLYDYATGKPKQMTDKNGFVYQTIYDGFGRVTEEKVPDISTPTNLVTKTKYIYTDTQNAVSIKKTDYLDENNLVDTYQYFDGLNRLIQERKESENSGTYNVSDIKYNNLGLKQSESLRYGSSGSAKTSPTTNNDLYTTYTYDPLQRILTSTNSAGTTSYVYNNWVTTVTDVNGKQKKFYKDAYDNLVKVDEINGSSTYSTNYIWNLNKKLTGITDALNNTRAFTYDGLGRRLTAQDLHASGDTTYGTWSYAYDNAGNLTQTTNPLSQIVSYAYDDINRITTENWTGGTGTEISYGYDTCTNGIGKLCSANVLGSIYSTYSYDANGNVKNENREVGEGIYETVYTNGRQGNLVNIKYPDNAEVKYTYNSAGLIEKIERKEAGSSFSDFVSNFDYNPMDQITSQVFVNGVTTTNTYDPAKLYRLTNRLTQKSGGPKLQDTSYQYDNIGNITKITDTSNTNVAREVDYTYDDLGRLSTAITASVAYSSPYSHSYTYNALGNILTSPTGTYLYQGDSGSSLANPHAPTSIEGVANGYNANGNLVTVGEDTTFTWDYKNQLVNYTKENPGLPDGPSEESEPEFPSTIENYKYDHVGDRVERQSGSTFIYYPNKYYSIGPSNKITKNVFVGDVLMGTIETLGSTATPRYFHTDYLNSTNVVTDPSGDMVELIDYLPYGNPRVTLGSYTPQRKYIGEHFDTATNLNYLNARYYNAVNGQFISEDPVFWELGQTKDGQTVLLSPQAQNSYSYSENNPITKSDPNGRCAVVCNILFGLFTPSVAYSPAPGEENKTNYALERNIMLMGFATPQGKNTIAKNIVQDGVRWSKGKVGNSLGNLLGHFSKHENELKNAGIDSAQVMYNEANAMIKNVDNQNIFKFSQGDGLTGIYNKAKNLLVGLNRQDEISTMHTVTRTDKFQAIQKEVSKIINKLKK